MGTTASTAWFYNVLEFYELLIENIIKSLRLGDFFVDKL
jgi:hypothetical protein